MLLRKGGGRSVSEGCAEDDGAPCGAESDAGGGAAGGFCCDAFLQVCMAMGFEVHLAMQGGCLPDGST